MKRLYAPGLTAAERHRISDTIYRMKKLGFIIPKELENTIKYQITDASSYQVIRRQVVRFPEVKYQAIRTGSGGRPYRAEGIVSGQLAEEVLEASAEWNKKRTQARKGGEPTGAKEVPRYKIAGVGPSHEQTKRLTQAQVNELFEMAFKRTRTNIKDKDPFTWVRENDMRARENLKKSLDFQMQNSPRLKKMILDKIAEMSISQLRDFYKRIGSKLVESMYEYPEGLLLGEGSTNEFNNVPILRLLNELGYDINAPAPDVKQGEIGMTIHQYVMNRNFTVGTL